MPNAACKTKGCFARFHNSSDRYGLSHSARQARSAEVIVATASRPVACRSLLSWHTKLARFASVLVYVFACTYGYAANHGAADQGPELDEKSWIAQAEKLVVTVTTTTPDAVEFRRDVRTSRAQLRQLVRTSGKQVSTDRQQLHETMILLDALLDAAAKCQSGNVIVCPPFLVQGLNAQLKNAHNQLATFERAHRTSDDASSKSK
jgi:hypothetical protein